MINTVKNFLIPILIVLSGILFYFNFTLNNKLTEKNSLLKASLDTLHTFKTTIGNQGAYISTLSGNRNDLISILQSKERKDSIDKYLIDSLKKDKTIQSISGTTTLTKIVYKDKLDSSERKVNLIDSVKSKWYDAYIDIQNDTLGFNINMRDELLFTQKLKKNKGLWTGSTLTSYAESLNPYTNIVGLTSVSTVVNKPAISIRPAIGFGLNSDSKGQNIRLGWNAGIVLTLK